MKLYGFFGKGSGKLGSSVFAISSGEQIVREYNPVVENPNTPAQVEQRAKFKLLSQLAAALASIIVIPKQGLVSSRNRFIGLNIGKATFEEGKAKFNLNSLDITGGSQPFPQINTNFEGVEKTIGLAASPSADVTSVVYIILNRTNDGGLSVVTSKVVTEPGNDGLFQAKFDSIPDHFNIIAYGIRGGISGILAKYENLDTDAASIFATLVAEKNESIANVRFTKNSVIDDLPDA